MNRYIIHLQPDTDIDAFAAELTGVVKILRRVRMIVIDTDQATVDALRDDPRVGFVEADQEGEPAGDVAVMSAQTQQIDDEWQLDRIDQRTLPLDGEYTWDRDGSGVRVYVLDGGIRATHIEFAGRIGPGYSAVDDEPYTDNTGHATAVASMLAGVTVGVARGAEICAAKFSTSSSSASSSDIVDAVDWILGEEASRGGRAVVNFSWSHRNSTVASAFADLLSAGIPVVVSAMNDGNELNPNDPVYQLNVMAVSSTRIDDSWGDHNYGARVDLLAPGRDVWVADYIADNGYRLGNGTSFAAPLVAGVVAMLLEANSDLSVTDVYNLLIDNATTGEITNVPANTTDRLLYSVIDVPEQVEPEPGEIFSAAGSFAKSATENTQAITGLGFKPEAIIFWGFGVYNVDPVEDDTAYNHLRGWMGIAAPNLSRAHMWGHTDGSGSSLNGRRGYIGFPIAIVNGGGNVEERARLLSFDADGFTIEWHTSSSNTFVINYLAIGGEVEAHLSEWQTPSSTGNVSVDDVPFQPDAVIHVFNRYDGSGISSFAANGTTAWSLGVMLADGTQWAVGTQHVAGSSPSNARTVRDDSVLAYPGTTLDGDPVNSASFESMNVDGFTVNVDGGADRWIISLSLKGEGIRTGMLEQPDTTGIQAVEIEDLTPHGVLFASTLLPASALNTGSKAGGHMVVGAGDANGSRSAGQSLPRGSTSRRVYHAADAMFVHDDADFDPIDARMHIDSLYGGGFDVDWTVTDSSGVLVPWIAFGAPYDDSGVPAVPQNFTLTAIDHQSALADWDPVE